MGKCVKVHTDPAFGVLMSALNLSRRKGTIHSVTPAAVTYTNR